jgi:choline dehydrogenase-like flavoprotein
MDTQPLPYTRPLTALNQPEAATLNALFEQLFPGDENGPGASSIGVIQYLDRALSGPYAHHLEAYRLGVYALDAESLRRFNQPFIETDSGGARMGENPEKSVLDPELEVHDTPGLYFFSGAAFPTCPGINPTLSLLALVSRAAERLVKQLTRGDHP